jgi:hypothetical protein
MNFETFLSVSRERLTKSWDILCKRYASQLDTLHEVFPTFEDFAFEVYVTMPAKIS